MPDMTPVPLLDGEGKPVFSKDEKGNAVQVMRPAGIDPKFFIMRGAQGDPADETGGYAVGKLTRDLPKFWQGHEWDVQRVGGWHKEFVDYSTIAIGLYGAAAGIPEELMLRAEDVYAWRKSDFATEKRDAAHTHLAERNVENTHIGYELYRSYTAFPDSGKQ